MKIRKRDLPHLTTRGWIVSVLVAASAVVSFIVSAVSLTRIAEEMLGFPEGLPWSLTGAVDIGAAAGAVLWVTSPARHPNRARGMWINVCCSSVSGIGVGLDHLGHASPTLGYQIAGFIVGAFLPALSTWLVHILAHLVTEAAESVKAAPAATENAPPRLAAVPTTKAVRIARAFVDADKSENETPEERRRRLDAERKRRARAAARGQAG